MLFRNLMAMDTEEMIRAQPIDGVVLLGNCDKTTPGAADGRGQRRRPGHHGHRRPDAQRPLATAETSAPAPIAGAYWTEYRAGTIDDDDIGEIEDALCPLARPLHGDGHGVSTMARVAEALGMALPGSGRDPRPGFAAAAPGRGDRPPDRRDRRGGSAPVADHDRARRSRTRSASAWRSAARPTPSST